MRRHSNGSDVGGALQRNNIHLTFASKGDVAATLARLKASLATDGDMFEAEDIESGETVACTFAKFPEHFGFFLTLAGISTVKQVRASAFDIRAISRLNRLYVEVLRTTPHGAAPNVALT